MNIEQEEEAPPFSPRPHTVPIVPGLLEKIRSHPVQINITNSEIADILEAIGTLQTAVSELAAAHAWINNNKIDYAQYYLQNSTKNLMTSTSKIIQVQKDLLTTISGRRQDV